MTIRILDYVRRNAIALTALGFSLLALGGASYAAINLPNNFSKSGRVSVAIFR